MARSIRSDRCAQGRKGELDDVQAKQQVVAELAGGNGGVEVAVGCGDQPDVSGCACGSRRHVRTAVPGETCSNFGWSSSGRSPISSRNSVPPSAAATFPSVSATAPVNEPRTWPKSSLSSRSALKLGQLTVTNGPCALRLAGMNGAGKYPLCRSRSRPGSTPRHRSRRPGAPGPKPVRTCGSLALERYLRHVDTDLLLQIGDLALQDRDALESLEHCPNLSGRERLRQIVECAAPHRIDGAVDAGDKP